MQEHSLMLGPYSTCAYHPPQRCKIIDSDLITAKQELTIAVFTALATSSCCPPRPHCHPAILLHRTVQLKKHVISSHTPGGPALDLSLNSKPFYVECISEPLSSPVIKRWHHTRNEGDNAYLHCMEQLKVNLATLQWFEVMREILDTFLHKFKHWQLNTNGWMNNLILNKLQLYT